MSKIFRIETPNNEKMVYFIAIIISILIGLASSFFSPLILVGLLFGWIYIFIWIRDFRYGLLITLLIRSSLDVFGDFSIGFIRITAVFGVFLIGITILLYLLGNIKFEGPLKNYFLWFLISTALPTFIHHYFFTGLETWLKFLNVALIYFLTYHIVKKQQHFLDRLINFMIYSSVVPLATGLHQILTGSGNHDTVGLNRIIATFVHPNPFAFYLVIVIVLCFYKLLMPKSKMQLVVVSIFLLAVIELYFTYTRGAWLGLALFFLLFLAQYQNPKKYLIFGLMIILLYIFFPKISDRFMGLFSTAREESSLATRFYIWGNMIRIAMENFLFGTGLGTFKIVTGKVLNWKIEAHNEYLRLFFETGIIGLSSYLALVIRTLTAHREHSKSIFSRLIGMLFLIFLILGLGDNIIDNLVSQWYLWSLVGASHALNNKHHFLKKGEIEFENPGC